MAADVVAGETGPAEFGILGPLEVCRSGCAVPLGGPRQRAVLALLLLEANRVVSMDRLAEDIWGGNPPEGWVTTLQTYVFHLRRALDPDRARGAAGDVLVTRGRGYLLRVDRERLDAARFQDGFMAGRAALQAGRYLEAAQTLRRALELWRNGVLADLSDYAFTRPEAGRLEELRLAALEARIDADLALGRHDALTGELEQLAADHPLRERLHAQLMLALYRCGRQAEALAAYRRVRDLLASELGIDPGEPLRHLHAAVLAHDPALDCSNGRETVAEGHRADAGPPPPSPTPQRRSPRSAALTRLLGWARRHSHRPLVAGLALAVIATVAIVTVATPQAGGPQAGGPAGLPGNTVGLIDPAGGRVGTAVSVGDPVGLAYGDGSVWAVDSVQGILSRINPATHAVIDQIPVGSAPSAVAVTGENVWVANSGGGTVSWINAAADLPVKAIPVGNLPVAIASGPSGVWVANEGDDTVDRIDPATGKVTRRVQVGGRPDGIAVGPDAVWVANGQDGTVTRIDPATGQPSGPVSVGSGPAGIAITPGAVWVANSLDLTVMKINPATLTVTATIGVGDGPSAIVSAKNTIWVSDEFNATLSRIDPRADQVTRSVFVGSSPQGLVATPSGVWAAAQPFAVASHLGGTLIVVDIGLPAIDPAQQAANAPWSITSLATVYDGLVAFRRSGGAAGLTLVPDLAMTLPRPADGGTTYTFTLRPEIHYSNGVLVRASDFRRGFERQLSFGPQADYYQGILGAPACRRHPPSCDLSAGIVTNDTTGTVTFHLSQPDPDFLYKLAELFATPAAPGTPLHHVIKGLPFLPGTGPYMISQYRPKSSFTLVRNPYFHQWSYAAQPAGYPSVIRYERVLSQSQQESAVITGRADLVEVGGGDNQSIAIRYPTRVHVGLKLGTSYVFLNTRQPPFTNVKARQAINYAIDRARILQFFHFAPGQAAATCQILPADFPGHQSYCPYTGGPENEIWHVPDMAKALRLVKDSGTANMPVKVLTFKDFPWREASSYLVRLLKELGYRARLDPVSFNRFFAELANSRTKIQMGFGGGWGADFPAPSTFFLPLLSCRSSHESPTSNWAEFCDPRVDKLASEAEAAQPTDPAAARRLWAQADRIVTNQAPYVPVYDQASAAFVSARVGNYQDSPGYGPLLDQMWVR
jgi:YVTN family beta-propeller protein